MDEGKADDDEMMLFYRRPMKVKDVEAGAKVRMELHDKMPRRVRDALNEYGEEGRARPGYVANEVYVRARSVADKYIRADGSKPAETDEEDITALELKVRAALAKCEAAAKAHREIDQRYKRLVAKVRYPLLNGFARRCLGHAECCGLRATQIEWLRELKHETVEVPKGDLGWRGLHNGFHHDMDRVMRIWFKIKANHEIEDATTGIEWEIEQEAVNREEEEARRAASRAEWAAWMAAQAKAVRLPRRWQTPSIVEIPKNRALSAIEGRDQRHEGGR
jgi:hypothetical protein